MDQVSTGTERGKNSSSSGAGLSSWPMAQPQPVLESLNTSGWQHWPQGNDQLRCAGLLAPGSERKGGLLPPGVCP